MAVARQPAFSVTKDDLEFQTFRSGGPGGQNQNRRDTGVRVIHHASGARGESREHRTQLENRKAALRRMTQTPAFRFWVHQELRRLDGRRTVEQQVDDMMQPQHVKVERRGDDGGWQPWDGD